VQFQLPERVHLPSGRVVRLSSRAATQAAQSVAAERSSAPPDGFSRALVILGAAGVLSDDDGQPVDLLAFVLRDAHVLRALFIRAGLIDEEVGTYSCQNCGAPFDASPSRLLEIAPFVDGELNDAELDAPFAFAQMHRIPALRVGRTVARTVRLAPRTVQESLALWRAANSDVLRVTPALVASMGVCAIGRERRSSAIAGALAHARAEPWRAIVDLFHAAHYPARLVAVHRCAECGARNDLDVPLLRELTREPLSDSLPRGVFPDLDAFERRVREISASVYRARGVQNIDLFIDAGVAACDEGGEPLLGSYTPGTTESEGGIAHPPEIRLYYRTFEAEARADPRFDPEREIRDTIDHEITHHLHFLAGSDPLDDEERGEIAQEQARIVGRSESLRRGRRGIARDLAEFLRVTWPLWLLLLLGFAISWCVDRETGLPPLGG
jgi:hypothetical protein